MTLARYFVQRKVYVRECYVPLMDSILKEILRNDFAQDSLVVVNGTPGMGKTTFLGYCYYYLKKSRIKVIAKPQKLKCIVYNGSVEFFLNTEAMDDLLSKSHEHEYILLLDSNSDWNPGVGVGYVVVLFTSPDVKNYGDFSSNSTTTMLMPPWDREELWNCFKLLKSSLATSRDDFNKAFVRWGGSISFHKRKAIAQERFKSFLASQELVMMVEMISNVELSKTVPTDVKTKHFQAFLFRHPDNPKFRFPSEQLSIEIADVYTEKMRSRPETLLGIHGTLLGVMYEAFVFKTLLCEGSTLPVKVKNQKEAIIDIPSVSSVDNFSSLPSRILEGVLYRPKDRTNEGFDCFLGDVVVQITTNPRHRKLNLGRLQTLIPIQRVKVVIITFSRNQEHFKKPSIKYGMTEAGVEQSIEKEDVYMYYFDFGTLTSSNLLGRPL